jgi:choline dehydrogenase-like flavoprotein
MGIIYGIEELEDRHEKYEVIKKDIVEDDVDVCIIGSGAAGAVLAKELVESGKKVVLLERGGYYEGKDMNQREVDMMPLLWKNAGFNFVDSLRIAIAQGSCLGGSTIINDAVCFDTPDRVREEWKKIGVNFSEEEWSVHLKRVNRILRVRKVADAELNRNNLMLKVGAKKIGLRDGRKNRRNCVNCMQCGFCHIGCHYETKQNVLVTYIHMALEAADSKMKIYCNCEVEKIIYKNNNSSRNSTMTATHESDNFVEAVEGSFIDIDRNKSYRIRINSKIVIVSAGAIASSVLLLQNRIAQDTAGRDLCLHPAIEVIGDFDYEIKGNQGIPMAYTVHDFGITRTTDLTRKKYGFNNGREFLIESIFLPILQFSIALSARGSVPEYRRLIERFNNYAMAGIMVRDGDIDGNIGRVSLTTTNRASVSYEPREKELKGLANGVKVLGKIWFALGARRIIIPHMTTNIIERTEISSFDDFDKIVDNIIIGDSKNLLLGSAHPQSGNKIGTDQANSVVDSDCKVHGFRNLFVCDASVFPTAVGVNPQITVMAVASIIASRIIEDWDTKYADIPVSSGLGETCGVTQPMYCRKDDLSRIFDSQQNHYDIRKLVNSGNWSFDPSTLVISNDSHWKGMFPRDTDIQNTLELYFGGFWKRFTKNDGEIVGLTHAYELPVCAANRATSKDLPGFGKVILLEYNDPPFNQFYDILKIVDENTILGKAFLGTPSPGNEVMTFSMSRKYPFEFMDREDHQMLYSKMKKPRLHAIAGIWEGQLVSDSTWTDPVFRFRFYFDSDENIWKNHYLLGGILAGTTIVRDKANHLETEDATGFFHNEIRQVNNNTMIGKYYLESNLLSRWLPEGLDFLHVDKTGSNVLLYVLKRAGIGSGFENTVKRNLSRTGRHFCPILSQI